MYLLIEQLPSGRWTWSVCDDEHVCVAMAPRPFERREESLVSAEDHLGGAIEVPVLERQRSRLPVPGALTRPLFGFPPKAHA